MKKALLIVSVALILLSSCAHKVDVSNCINNQSPYGFWGGLWHGIISPFSLISMIWSDNVMYSPNNNGGWYAFGFALGAGILGFGSSKAKTK
jgi:hypothetical protein